MSLLPIWSSECNFRVVVCKILGVDDFVLCMSSFSRRNRTQSPQGSGVGEAPGRVCLSQTEGLAPCQLPHHEEPLGLSVSEVALGNLKLLDAQLPLEEEHLGWMCQMHGFYLYSDLCNFKHMTNHEPIRERINPHAKDNIGPILGLLDTRFTSRRTVLVHTCHRTVA